MSMESIVLKVDGMSCSHCENRVKKAVAGLDGVQDVAVSLEDKTVTVAYDSAILGVALLQETIEDQGYDVV